MNFRIEPVLLADWKDSINDFLRDTPIVTGLMFFAIAAVFAVLAFIAIKHRLTWSKSGERIVGKAAVKKGYIYVAFGAVALSASLYQGVKFVSSFRGSGFMSSRGGYSQRSSNHSSSSNAESSGNRNSGSSSRRANNSRFDGSGPIFPNSPNSWPLDVPDNKSNDEQAQKQADERTRKLDEQRKELEDKFQTRLEEAKNELSKFNGIVGSNPAFPAFPNSGSSGSSGFGAGDSEAKSDQPFKSDKPAETDKPAKPDKTGSSPMDAIEFNPNPFGESPSDAKVDLDLPRKWVSSDGKFKVEAKLVKVEDGVVVLLRTDNGETIRVPLNNLSDGDRKLLEKK